MGEPWGSQYAQIRAVDLHSASKPSKPSIFTELLELGRSGGRKEQGSGVHQAGITVFPLVRKSWWSRGIQTASSSGII